jgi:hypothetical protein
MVNGVKVFRLLSAILAQASSWAAKASSRSVIICLILSSIEGNLVFLYVNGNAFGHSPWMISNDVFGQLACLQLL